MTDAATSDENTKVRKTKLIRSANGICGSEGQLSPTAARSEKTDGDGTGAWELEYAEEKGLQPAESDGRRHSPTRRSWWIPGNKEVDRDHYR